MTKCKRCGSTRADLVTVGGAARRAVVCRDERKCGERAIVARLCQLLRLKESESLNGNNPRVRLEASVLIAGLQFAIDKVRR